MVHKRLWVLLGLNLFLGGLLAACAGPTPDAGDAPLSTVATPATSAAATDAPAATPPAVLAPATDVAMPTTPATEPAEEESMPDPSAVPGTVEPGLEDWIRLAQADLAQRLSIPVEQIEVLEAKSVVWPDASLGCPLPDMRYKQVPQDGSLIRLAVEGRVYEYHSGGGRDPFLCEPAPQSSKDPVPKLDLTPPGSESD
jgi:hypothetical protein